MAREGLSTPRVRNLAPPHVEADRQCLVARVLNDISTSDMEELARIVKLANTGVRSHGLKATDSYTCEREC